MSEFKVGDRVRRTMPNVKDVKRGEVYTVRSVNEAWDELDFEGLGDFGYCMENFELVEENMNKGFTKDMLVAGTHVVELRDGSLRMVLANGILAERIDHSHLDYYNNDLTHNDDKYDVVSVYALSMGFPLGHYLNKTYLNLIWKREEKSQSQIELEKLQKQIFELQEQANKLQTTL